MKEIMRITASQELVSTGTAGKMLGLSREQVRKRCIAGEFDGAYKKEGRHWRIPLRSIRSSIPSTADETAMPEVDELGEAFSTIGRYFIAIGAATEKRGA